MSITSKFSMKLANIFSNDKKSQEKNSQVSAASADLEAAQEKARKEQLVLTKTSRLGFPYRPTCMSYDPVQHLLAIGTKHGYVKLYGGELIEYTLFHGSAPQSFTPIPSYTPLNNSPGANNANSFSRLASTSANAMSSSSALSFPSAVLFMAFVVNEGALITYCDDNTWSFLVAT